jgi:hypothetical protein
MEDLITTPSASARLIVVEAASYDARERRAQPGDPPRHRLTPPSS